MSDGFQNDCKVTLIVVFVSLEYVPLKNIPMWCVMKIEFCDFKVTLKLIAKWLSSDFEWFLHFEVTLKSISNIFKRFQSNHNAITFEKWLQIVSDCKLAVMDSFKFLFVFTYGTTLKIPKAYSMLS